MFLEGNGLPQCWAARQTFVVLDTGFGLGHRFLATWQAWRDDPARSERLVFIAMDEHPLPRADLSRGLAECGLPAMAQALCDAWPPLTPNLHTLDFDDGRVRLMLVLGEVAQLLPQVLANVDAFYLDESINPLYARTPSTAARIPERLGRVAALGATLVAQGASHELRDDLLRAGFEATTSADLPEDVMRATFRPHFKTPPAPARRRTPQGEHHALIVGAGLAGCAAAAALAHQGWRVTVLERAPAAAQGASGNTAGLFHGTFNVDDGPHARWHRAGALHMARVVRPWLVDASVAGQADGLLRLEHRLSDEQAQAAKAHSGLPPDYLSWWPHRQAQDRIGCAAPSGGWFFPAGGWLSPGDVCRRWLQAPGVTLMTDASVTGLTLVEAGWCAMLADGRTLQAPHFIVANAQDAGQLLAPWLPGPWLSAVRGQTTLLPPDASRPTLRLPVAGAGYALSLPDGRLLCGATTQHADGDNSVRQADHLHNLRQLNRLLGVPVAPPLNCVSGRTGWRATTRDRLPMIGPVPALPFGPSHLPMHRRARLWDEASGLYVFTCLASRGLSTAALGAEVLASWVTGSPCPVEADLRDAVDVARGFHA